LATPADPVKLFKSCVGHKVRTIPRFYTPISEHSLLRIYLGQPTLSHFHDPTRPLYYILAQSNTVIFNTYVFPFNL